MTLDPVHFEGITRLAQRVQRDVDPEAGRDVAETVWEEYLDSLYGDGRIVLEPLGEKRRRSVDVERIALQNPPFPTRHGLDSGTINPTTFRNGITLDVAQAAMSAVPSDLELHRGRTVVMTVHSTDATVHFEDDEWTMGDEGYTRERVLHAPRVDRYETAVVHELALYLAESHHAFTNADVVEDLLVLDGPVYPKGLLNWADREPELAELVRGDESVRGVVENYLRLVERFVEREVPLVGFVKSPVSRAITRAVGRSTGNAPWVNDAAFWTSILEPRADGERDTDRLTFTNWWRSRRGADAALAADADALGLERRLDPELYEVTSCAIYDPRTDVVYRLEAPAAFTRDPDLRERLVRQVLIGVAAERGPPLSVAKADDLARIGREETEALRTALERTLDADVDTNYDDERAARWGVLR
jgi:hypothetical protein